MTTKLTKRLIREGDFVAEVDVHLVEEEGGWSPYLSLDRWCFDTPHIQLHCEIDRGPRRFDPTSKTIGLDGNSCNYTFITYRCRDCQTTSKTFAVLIDQGDSADGEAMKLGEFPPFSAPISSRIQKLLSESDLELYRKGVRAEAQGLGIGAATYFRRIVEEQWQRLVTEIRQAAVQLGVEDIEQYDAALQETQFSKVVGMLTDVIPGKIADPGWRKPANVAVSATQQAATWTDG